MSELKNERLPTIGAKRPPGLRLALLAGILLWLSCPASPLWPLAWIALSPLILSITRASRFRQAVWRGYMFGLVYLGFVWYWTGNTVVAWTHSEVGRLAWLALTLIAALFYAAWGGAAWLLGKCTASWYRILAFSAAWVVMEWTRTLGRITGPWAQISYTQYRCLPLIQIAEVTGAYGISFLIVLFNATVAEWWADRANALATRRMIVSACTAVVIGVLGAMRANVPEEGPKIAVAAMQPNFHVNSESNTGRDLSVFASLSDQADASKSVSLFVWPETAAPEDAVHDYRTYGVLRGIAERYHAAVATGSQVIDPKTHAAYNSSVLITGDGSTPQRYDKVHLLPFGEFIPYRDLLPSFLESAFQIPTNDLTPGATQIPLHFETQNGMPVALGPFICYESMYPNSARAMTAAGANLLITQSNDDWFKSESALEQHLSAVVMRAVENRRCVVRSTSTGITCIIDSHGVIVGAIPVNSPGSVVRMVRLRSALSIYNRFGDWFVLLCGVYVMGIFARSFLNRRIGSESEH